MPGLVEQDGITQIDNPEGRAQFEFRLRCEAIPGNLHIEATASHLMAGDLMNDAINGSASYFYSQSARYF